MMLLMIFVFQNLPEHDINKEGILHLQYSFVLTFHKHIFTIGQDQSSLLNHCLSTQRRPHARPCAVPHALLSDRNNTTFYYKQLLLPIQNRLLLEKNSLLLVNNRMVIQVLTLHFCQYHLLVNSKPDHPPQGNFFDGEFPTAGQKKEFQTPTPRAYKKKLKPHPQGIFLNYSL